MDKLIDPTIDREDVVGLRQEAAYLYHCLISRNAPQRLVDGYLAAHSTIPGLRFAGSEQQHTVDTIVTRQLDALSIEPWLRGAGLRHALSAKLLLLAYLAESDGLHDEFSRSVPRGWLSLFLAGLHAGLQLLRGRYLILRYGLV